MSKPDLTKAIAGVQRQGFSTDLVTFSLTLLGHHPDCDRNPELCESLCEGANFEEIVEVTGCATPSPLHSGCYDVLAAETVYPLAAHSFMRDEDGIRAIDASPGPFYLKYPAIPLEEYLKAVKRFRAPWHTTAEILELADLEEDWLWEPYILFGGMTLLIADSGAGKSTFVTSLLDSVLRGEPFLDCPTAKAHVFYVSEEAVKGIRRRTETPEPSAVQTSPLVHWMYWGQKVKTKAKDTNGAILKDPQGKDVETWSHITWEIIRDKVEQTLEQLNRTSLQKLPAILVIDTLSFWLELDDSNGAMDVISALKPLREFAQRTGIAILGLHHSNRQVEQAGKRNSTTYTGNMQWKAQSDVMLFLQYAPADLADPTNDDPRTLEMYKTRFDDVPDLRLRFNKQQGYYRGTASPRAQPGYTLTEIDRGVLNGYPKVKDGSINQQELAAELEINPSQVSRSIAKLREQGKIV